MANKAQDLIKNLRSQEKQQPERQSEWGRCDITGCPMQCSIKAARNTCGYHHGMYTGLEADYMTRAIRLNASMLNKYAEMLAWSVWDWKQKRMSIIGWHVLPLGEEEPPSSYLVRFKEWVDKQIKDKASELEEGNL